MKCVRLQTLIDVPLITIFLFAFHTRLLAQDTPADLRLRAAAVIQNAEPDWKYTPEICVCVRVVKDVLATAGGSWRKSLDDSTVVSVDIYSMTTVRAATTWLSDQTRNRRRNGWTRHAYRMADAILTTHDDPSGLMQVNLTGPSFLLTC
jgi:hypothetical protein